MKERSSITILVISLLILGLLCIYASSVITKFTFYSSEIHNNGNTINETLTYKPLFKEYHTLYRNFLTPIEISSDKDYISITNVRCSAGAAYYNDVNNVFNSSESQTTLRYTEKNEYGCGFGENTGFKKKTEYKVSAVYNLNTRRLYEFNGKTYIKFIVYSKDTHPLLIRYQNFKLDKNVYSKNIYLASEDVIIYIPFSLDYAEDASQYSTIISLNKLKFNSNSIIFIIIFALMPAILCLIAWLWFGRENAEGDYPEELSQYPKERKAWEIAAYFHPPFGQAGMTLLPATIIDFYNQKIIDIKDVDKHTYIKILQEEPNLDDVEKTIFNFLKEAKKQSPRADGYFSLEEINKDTTKAKILNIEYKKIRDIITSKSAEYIDNKGLFVILASIMLMTIISLKITGNGYLAILYVISLAIVIIIMFKTSLFSKFKKDYYLEYQQWKGFNKYLSHLDSIPRTPYQCVVMWEKYLIYASALGSGTKVLKALKKWDVINEKQYHVYNSINNRVLLPSSSSSSGAGGGMGGGGIGGGGGGGR